MQQYVTINKLRRAGLLIVKGAVVALFLVLAVQLAYPRSWTLPGANIGGKVFGYQSHSKIIADISAMQDQPMNIVSGDQILKPTPKQLGITFEARKDAEALTRYSWRERLVPLSFIWKRPQIPHYSFSIDESKARAFAESLKKYDQPPVDAALVLEGADLTVVKQQDGYVYDTAALMREIKAAALTESMSLSLNPVIKQPAITDAMVADAGSRLQQRLEKPIAIEAAGKSASVNADVLASWAVIVQDQADKKFRVAYDKTKIKQWLSGLAGQVYIAATPKTVTMVDGAVARETPATEGRSLNVDATLDGLVRAIDENKTEVAGKTQPVAGGTQTLRTYSRSSKGLQALLEYWDSTNAGTWGVVMKSFDGSVEAAINPDKQFTSASVYKIYVAYIVYDKIDNGGLSMDSAAGSSNTVGGCLDKMIVRSDNECAIILGDLIGWEANDGKLHAKGFGSTTITRGGHLTTPRDATSYLMQLQGGSLMATGYRDALLHKMSNNIYRYAIPAGSDGGSANKLGAAGAFNHDVAIVYHPNGTYALSVFTQGSNHYRIRDLAREISNIMNQ